MKKKISFILLILMMFFVACKKDDSINPVSNDVVPVFINVSLTSPFNGATNQDTSIVLSWSGSASSYDLYFGTNSSALTKIVSDTSGTSYTKNELNKETTYYWKVVGKKGSVLDTSKVWSFSTKNDSINVSLTSPFNGATNQDTSIVLSWSGSASSYDLYFGTNSSALTKIVSDTSGTSYTKNELNKETTYYWKVVGKKGSVLDTSKVWSFSTKNSPINISLTSPVNGATNQDTSIVLSWSGSASSYDLYFGTNSSALTKIVSDTSGTSYTKNELNKETTYYWKVVGKKGSVLDTSKVWSFSTKIINIEMIFVEADTFSMGSTSGEDDEKPVHKVKITNNFYIGKYEVTNEQLVKVFNKAKEKNIGDLSFTSSLVSYKSNNLLLINGTSISYNSSTGYLVVNNSRENYAAKEITYYGAQAFVEFLNTLNNTNIYKLPTEAQWEFAARGGKQSQHYTYSGSNTIDDVAWYIINSSTKTSYIVGQKNANELGIYDMSGNVAEWCSDWYGSYSSEEQTDPTGASSGEFRVYRGGAYNYNATYSRVTRRMSAKPDINNYNGFRIIKSQ